MKLKDYSLGSKDGKIHALTDGAGRKKYLDEDQLYLHLKQYHEVKSINIWPFVEELQNEARESYQEITISTQKVDLIKELNPFKNFKQISNITNKSNVIYYHNGLDTEVVCTLSAFDSKILKNVLEQYDKVFLKTLHKGLATIMNPKDWTSVSVLQSLDLCFNSGLDIDIPIVQVTSDPHPAIVEGTSKFSLTIIPYKQSTNITLNPYLKDFLERTEYHEYLCAILWSHFIGNLLPYVIYLRGDGGDGKTSFINMLGKLARSYSNFDGGDRFNYFNMFGKSIIGLNENESSKLMQNRVVKSISGGNNVQIEGKGKNSFTGQVRGLIIIDSNYDLELMSREDEKRRLRYFEVKSINKSENHVIIAQDTFLDHLGSTPNEFLNYCRLCYENLNVEGSGGLIQKTPNHDETFARLTDPLQEHKFDEFYTQNIYKYYYRKEGSQCETVDILMTLEKKFPKDQWVQRNFKKYLQVKYNIKVSGKYFIGLIKGNKELEEAMPK